MFCFEEKQSEMRNYGIRVMVLVNKVIFCVNDTLNQCRNAQNMHTSNECSICQIKYCYDVEFLGVSLTGFSGKLPFLYCI